jgi:L-erythro-3,5-diaminohexanoate dehydrogenase
VSVLCVDAPGCEHAAILATRQGGTVVFFTMAASLQAAALGAEGVGADIWLLVGNGHVTKGPDYALELLHECPELGYFLEPRSGAQHDRVSSGDGRA